MSKRSWNTGDLALDKDGRLVKIATIRREDGVDFAWITYPDGDGPDPATSVDRDGIVFEHGLNDRECFSTHYPVDENGAYLRAWDGGIVQEFVTSQERGLREVQA